ncbi:MAG TPA: ABC transporter transmembrane domain-containing protein, partial [Devosia sp.]|nr:ABC transporter transmembrane domain-containing protein [Devosia sp.]
MSTETATADAAGSASPPHQAPAAPAPTKSLQPRRRLLPFILRYPWRLGLTVGFLFIAAIATLVIPALAGQIIDRGFIERNLDVLATYSWIAIAVAFVMAFATGARFYFISILGERVLTDLRKAVFDHLLGLDATFYDTHRVGELTSRLVGDVTTIRDAIGSSLSMTLRGLIIIVGAVVLMFVTSWWLALAVLVIAPLTVMPVLFLARRLRKMSRRTQDALAEMSAMATEALGASRTIKSFVQEPHQSRAYGERAESSFTAEVARLGGRSAMIGGVMFTTIVALVVMVWWGATSVASGAVSTGQLTQFMIYALMATNSFTMISEVLGSLQTVSGATERLFEILDTKPAIATPEKPIALPAPPLGTVAFEGVSFAYGTRDNEPILTDLSFAVRRGETVALVGASGAGKTTVFALAQRFYDVSAGRVLVDGVGIRQVSPAELRQRFAYVKQEPTIFAGTVTENIRFGKPDATQAEVEAAARAALVHDFVSALEHGYDSVVGERGVMLS